MAAWVFLTIGIALGSWWAYYELGWGGFWAWDPVENASFMPWLAGTALIHSVRALEVRGAFRAWTALLAILSFSLSLIGTFLVRSGVLTSVHAFATDPARGLFILFILGGFIGGALALFAVRGPNLRSSTGFEPVSREGGLLANNMIMVAACATVFIGTFYPLFIVVATGERLSVGAPYFNAVFPPFMAAALAILSPAASLAWKKGSVKDAMRRLAPAAATAAAIATLAAWFAWPKSVAAALGIGLAVWAGAGAISDLAVRVRLFERYAGARLANLPRSYVAMIIGHVGFAIVAIGVIGAGALKSETIVYAREGDTVSVGGFDARLLSVTEARGPNYESEISEFEVSRGGKLLSTLHAERRFYPVRGMQTTEAAIASDLTGDLYLTIGDYNVERGWVVRAWRHPLTIWMWIGAGLIALGGTIGVIGERRRAPVRRAGAAEAISV
ncbi:MAG: heme lyase CcmF/NrfE family subunit [Parvularculaceae bacterium]|nr:heme lyase CcmF/NrfE family subunit [Parvularculaceae bacterium]